MKIRHQFRIITTPRLFIITQSGLILLKAHLLTIKSAVQFHQALLFAINKDLILLKAHLSTTKSVVWLHQNAFICNKRRFYYS